MAEDRQMKMRDIEIVDISDWMHNILLKELEMEKLCAPWIPRLLIAIASIKNAREKTFQQCLLIA